MNRSPLQRQQGITLIICMIILLVLTVMGLSSIRDTGLEEKMAGNLKNHNTAFQAAESALREGEDYIQDTIETPAGLPPFDGSNGLYPELSSMWGAHASSWAVGSKVRSFGGVLSGVASAPVFIIEQLDFDSRASVEAGKELGTQVFFYRITARAVGSTDTAVVVLQSIYKG